MSTRQVSALTEGQIDQLVDWFGELWWTTGRTRSDVTRMLAHCEVIALVDGEALVAFARVISDRVYKALILDVVVDRDRRGQGIGAALLDAIMAHESVASCAHRELYCAPDMVELYERYGFTAELGALTFMRAERG